MLAEDLKTGRNIWFKAWREDRDGEMKKVYGRGIIKEVTDDNVMVEGMEETKGRYSVKPSHCYQDEFEMKIDKVTDEFETRIYRLAEDLGYNCKKLINNAAGTAVSRTFPSLMQPGRLEALKTDVQMDMNLFAGQFKDNIKRLADNFTEKVQEAGLESLNKETKNLIFHTDLSQLKPDREQNSDIILTDDDIRGIGITAQNGMHL